MTKIASKGLNKIFCKHCITMIIIIINITKQNIFFFQTKILTVQGGCIQGSPSICIGKVLFVVITTEEHWARRRPDALRPVLTCPIWRQFSRPITSMSLSPISVRLLKYMRYIKHFGSTLHGRTCVKPFQSFRFSLIKSFILYFEFLRLTLNYTLRLINSVYVLSILQTFKWMPKYYYLMFLKNGKHCFLQNFRN